MLIDKRVRFSMTALTCPLSGLSVRPVDTCASNGIRATRSALPLNGSVSWHVILNSAIFAGTLITIRINVCLCFSIFWFLSKAQCLWLVVKLPLAMSLLPFRQRLANSFYYRIGYLNCLCSDLLCDIGFVCQSCLDPSHVMATATNDPVN